MTLILREARTQAEELKYEPCHVCHRIEFEPFTPAAFDAMGTCVDCERPVCSECADHDLNRSGRGTYSICKDRPPCEERARANAKEDASFA